MTPVEADAMVDGLVVHDVVDQLEARLLVAIVDTSQLALDLKTDPKEYTRHRLKVRKHLEAMARMVPEMRLAAINRIRAELGEPPYETLHLENRR